MSRSESSSVTEPTAAAPTTPWPLGGQMPSARSFLLTILGEFVHTRSGEVWTGTLVTALGALGIEEKSARQALSRAAAEGLLASSRHGRRVRWTLTPVGRALLQEGTERIYGFLRSSHGWDGGWLVLTVAVPESQRQLRHRLRTRLTWLGMGSPSPGLWVVPDPDKEHQVRAALDELGLLDRAFAWSGSAVNTGDIGRLISTAWDLGDVEKRYLTFIETFESLTARTPEEAFVDQVALIQAWRQFPFLDPDLPTELLEADWPGPRAAATFHDRHDRWHRLAQEHWEGMARDADSRS